MASVLKVIQKIMIQLTLYKWPHILYSKDIKAQAGSQDKMQFAPFRPIDDFITAARFEVKLDVTNKI